jgi:hypothetical protein
MIYPNINFLVQKFNDEDKVQRCICFKSMTFGFISFSLLYFSFPQKIDWQQFLWLDSLWQVMLLKLVSVCFYASVTIFLSSFNLIFINRGW